MTSGENQNGGGNLDTSPTVGADKNRALRLIEGSRSVFVAEGERVAEDLRLMDDWMADR